MEHHKPWLASFVLAGLTDCLRQEIGEDASDYDVRKLDDDGNLLQLQGKATCARYIHITEFPRPPTHSQRRYDRGTVSDGKHSIKAKFSRHALTTLTLMEEEGRQHDPTFRLFKLVNPTLRLEGGFEPPRLELAVNSLDLVRVRSFQDRPWSCGSSIYRETEIIKLLTEYSVSRKLSSQLGSQPHHSPESIRSQPIASSDRSTNSEEEPVSQDRFYTQAPFAQGNFVPEPHGPIRQSRYNPELLKRLQQEQNTLGETAEFDGRNVATSTPPDAALRDDGRDRSRESSAPATTRQPSNGSYASNVVQGSTPTRSRPPAQSPDIRLNANKTLLEERKLLKFTSDATKTDSGLAAINIPEDQSMQLRSLPEPQVEMVRPSKSISHFERWREESTNGRYLPRYIQKIPPDQLKLLESDDAWQPPLVGRTLRPGNIPLSLLEMLSKAADDLSEPYVPTSKIDSPELAPQDTRHDSPGDVPLDELEHSQQPLCDISDNESTDSEVLWSSSPPTQRRQLPPDSSPGDLLRFVQPMEHKDTLIEKSVTPQTEQSAVRKPTLSLDDRAAIEGAQRKNHCNHPQNEDKYLQTSSPDSEQHPVSPHPMSSTEAPSNSQEPKDEMRSRTVLKEGPVGAIVQRSSQIHRPKVIQVERTPYIGKTSSTRSVPSEKANIGVQGAGVSDAHPISSAFVPATFDESMLDEGSELFVQGKTSGVKASGLNALPPLRLDPVPDEEGDARQEVDEAIDMEDQEPGNHDAFLEDLNAENEAHQSKDKNNRTTIQFPEQQHLPTKLATLSNIKSECIESSALPSNRLASSKLATDHIVVRESTSGGSADQHTGPQPDSLSSKTHGHDSKRKRGQITGEISDRSSKRQRTGPAQEMSRDQGIDYIYTESGQELEILQHETLKEFERPSVPRRPSHTSSIQERDSAVNLHTPARPPLQDRQSRAWAEEPSKQPSTPITGMSVYTDVENVRYDATAMNTALQAGGLTTVACRKAFATFKESYRDYQGQLDDFNAAIEMLKTLIKSGRAPHPYLFDDAVFHHYHSFRQFLLKEVLTGATPMTYDEFYNKRIPRPTHNKELLTTSLVDAISESYGHMGLSVNLSRSQHDCDASKITQMNETKSQNSTVEKMSEGGNSHILNERREANGLHDKRHVEEWLRHASPELGTPDVDRSLSQTPKSDPPAPLAAGKNSSHHSQRMIAPTFTAMLMEPGAASKSKAPRNLPKSFGQSRPSASPLVKPPKPTARPRQLFSDSDIKRRIPQPSQVIANTRDKWWLKPYQKYMEQHSSLPSEKMLKFGNGPNQRGNGIDISKWRK